MITHKSRRRTDWEFDEICRDYETLKADLAELQKATSVQGSSSIQADIRESLSGLDQEIRQKISTNCWD